MDDGLIAKAVGPDVRAPLEHRDAYVDALRGFAILGIILVNFQGAVAGSDDSINRVAAQVIDLLATNSFYPLFSVLFGVGFAIQSARWGTHQTELHLRRMAVLFILGTIHSVLVWSGDILADYAFFGLLLLLARRLPLKLIPAIAVVLLVSPILAPRARALTEPVVIRDARVQFDGLRRGSMAEDASVLAGASDRTGRTYLSDVRRRWLVYRNETSKLTKWSHVFDRNILALFLMGYWAGRRGGIRASPHAARRFGSAAAVALAAACAGLAFMKLRLGGPPELRRLSEIIANYSVTVVYVSAMFLAAVRGGRPDRVVLSFCPVGRMALSNYLLQSIVMTWLFVPYGGARPYPTATSFIILNVSFFFLVQVPVSRYWLSRFRFGPVEWVWRSLVYGTFQPMRHISVSELASAQSRRPSENGETALAQLKAGV
jgi:uncharacterized protein